jgi:hypothetical protein
MDNHYLTNDYTCQQCKDECEDGCLNANTCTPPYPDPEYSGPIIYYDRASVEANVPLASASSSGNMATAPMAAESGGANNAQQAKP